ncbi:MAG: UDP-3-O-(3-hydroxymyristoyl)glucosamine N-acyltransferase [Rickettsiales bacterium]|jgi:UDP-3-O-[3-hydroxymyristoyl] glucosamine N-acyltransferase|nr:UDP-3-O-(3-hydroxymyristoyl)glucosamine N-acyltransferase [Rickettsiales bacterium]
MIRFTGKNTLLHPRDNFSEFGLFKNFFYRKREYVTVAEIAGLIEVKNVTSLDGEAKIYDVNTLARATKKEITFLSNIKYKKDLERTEASYCIVDENHSEYLPEKVIPIVVDNVQYACAILLDYMYTVPQFLVKPGVATGTWVDPTAKIGDGTEIQSGVSLGKGVIVGSNCKICSNVVVNHDCRIADGTYVGANSTISYAEIGKNVTIHSGVSIGQCGFGFASDAVSIRKIPQLGLVVIGNNVEIGSGTCIDRGALENTTIGDNSKLDNLVQIGHGVRIGRSCFITAQVGIAGSTVIGNYAQIGGKAGIAGHITIGERVKIAAYSGIMKNIGDDEAVGGIPAMPVEDWHRLTIALKKLIKRGN